MSDTTGSPVYWMPGPPSPVYSRVSRLSDRTNFRSTPVLSLWTRESVDSGFPESIAYDEDDIQEDDWLAQLPVHWEVQDQEEEMRIVVVRLLSQDELRNMIKIVKHLQELKERLFGI